MKYSIAGAVAVKRKDHTTATTSYNRRAIQLAVTALDEASLGIGPGLVRIPESFDEHEIGLAPSSHWQ